MIGKEIKMKSMIDNLKDEVFYSKDECGGGCAEVAIAYACDSLLPYAERLAKALLSGGIRAYLSDGETKCARIIALGNVAGVSTSRDAMKLLGEISKKSEILEGAYAITSDGRSVSIVADVNKYTTYQPIEAAIDIFIERSVKCCDLDIKAGVISSGVVDLLAKQTALDDIENEERWAHVREVIGDEDIYLAFRDMMESIFAKEMIPLIASFYDPATGMFYCSGSGKRAEGIYPIPEGTSQVLGYMQSTGMLRKFGKKYAVPELTRHRIIYHLKSIQGEDGEFYVSQMKKNTIDSNRIGRDRGHCAGLLSTLGARHTYSVGDYIGDGVSADEYWASLVAEGIVTEEEKPIIYWAEDPSDRKAARSTAEKKEAKPTSAGTEQFQSHEGFIKWLLAKDPYNNPYSAMSNTASAAGIIKEWNGRVGEYAGEDTVISYNDKEFDLKKGDTLYTIIIRWVNSHVNAAGLFGKITNGKDENGNPIYDGFYEGWGYQNSNGFLKGIGRYSETKTRYPMPREAIVSLLKGINSDEVVTGNILVIFNVWAALNGLRGNIKSFYEGEERDELLAMINDGLTRKILDESTGEMKAYAAVAIKKCTGKLLTFKKRDGGFAHSISQGTPCWQGGVKVGVAEDNLSDIDAINCSTALLASSLCDFFGLNRTRDIPMYTECDLLRFVDVMMQQQTVIKKGPMELEKK